MAEQVRARPRGIGRRRGPNDGVRASRALAGSIESQPLPLNDQAAILDVEQPGALGNRARLRRGDAQLKPERGRARGWNEGRLS